MAKGKWGIDKDALTQMQMKIADLGYEVVKQATINALTKSKEYANQKVAEAMESSPYNFKGVGRSTGRAKAASEEVAKMPVEVVADFVYAYVGVSWNVAPEVTYLAYGTPHIQADAVLFNAVKVKGDIEKQVLKIQQEEFNKVIKEAMK